MDDGKYCYGCKHLTRKGWGDGSTQYGCSLKPGIVLAISSEFDDDEPVRCDNFEK